MDISRMSVLLICSLFASAIDFCIFDTYALWYKYGGEQT
jgi:hypothetical protein